jgi:RimJ/RimL family protein N-acetyltransferase
MKQEIFLRPFSRSDFQRLISWIDTPELLVQWAGPIQFSFPLSPEQLEDYLADSGGAPARRRIYTAFTSSEVAFGHVEIGAIDHANQTGSLCRVLVSPAFQGKGLSLPIVREALRIGFDDLELRRIDLKVFSFNKAAIRCYERMGFVQEGLLRKAVKVGESYWDTILMAILREEWKSQAPE